MPYASDSAQTFNTCDFQDSKQYNPVVFCHCMYRQRLPVKLAPCFRGTGIRQSALIPLQKQFGLSCLQGGMLTANNSLALAANENRVPCCCGATGQKLY